MCDAGSLNMSRMRFTMDWLVLYRDSSFGHVREESSFAVAILAFRPIRDRSLVIPPLRFLVLDSCTMLPYGDRRCLRLGVVEALPFPCLLLVLPPLAPLP